MNQTPASGTAQATPRDKWRDPYRGIVPDSLMSRIVYKESIGLFGDGFGAWHQEVEGAVLSRARRTHVSTATVEAWFVCIDARKARTP